MENARSGGGGGGGQGLKDLKRFRISSEERADRAITCGEGRGWTCFVKQISQLDVMANIQLLHSAVIEHTNRVIYMEDDDVAAVVNGSK